MDIVRVLLSKGRLSGEDKVWKAGMSEWTSISSITEFRQSLNLTSSAEVGTPPPIPAEAGQSSENIYASPKAVEVDKNIYAAPQAVQSVSEDVGDTRYGGMRRLSHNISVAVLFTAFVAVFAVVDQDDLDSYGYREDNYLYDQILSIPFLILAKFRLKNLGMSGWNLLWSFVPIGNIWLSFRLWAYPEGYADHGELDKAGKILVALYILMILAIVGLIFVIFYYLGELGIEVDDL